jgi:YD repeat-containing protein
MIKMSIKYDNTIDRPLFGTPSSAGSLVQQSAYTYDKSGNRTIAISALATNSSKYNNLNELVRRVSGTEKTFAGHITLNAGTTLQSVTIDDIPATISSGTNFQGIAGYSSFSNVVTVMAVDSTGARSTNQWKINAPGVGAAATNKFDLDGNLIANSSAAGETNYEWDAANRLTAINYRTSSAPGTRSEFTYDGLSRRVRIVERNAAGAITSDTRYIWNGIELCEQRDLSNARLKQYFAEGFTTIKGVSP